MNEEVKRCSCCRRELPVAQYFVRRAGRHGEGAWSARCTECPKAGYTRRIGDLEGQRFGSWLVLERALERCQKGHVYYRCRCDCGREKPVYAASLISGASTRCLRCARRGHPGYNRTHGATGTPTYESWLSMRSRCSHPERTYYYGRGITVCPQWQESFERFLADMGERPGPEYTLERLDRNGNYEPGNVVWATPLQQGRNKRNNRWLSYAGQTKTVSEWARESGLSLPLLLSRLNRGWSAQQALSTPPRPLGQRRAGRPVP